MFNSAKYQMDFLNKLSFNRFGGTKDEERAAKLIAGEIGRLGGKAEIEEFEIAGYTMKKASLEVLAPAYKKIEANGIGRTGSTNGPVEAELFYAEGGEEENFKGAEGAEGLRTPDEMRRARLHRLFGHLSRRQGGHRP